MARRRRIAIRAHSGELWERLYQLIKVEEPITFDDIRRLCRGVDLNDLDYTLREMCCARKISVARDWSGARLIETYCYGSEAASVTLALAA